MRIAEIEAKMEQGNCSEEIMDLFRTALKHVPKSGRCQHCYITAASMPIRNYKQAISLIKYGLSAHCDSWVDRMRSFRNMAIIYEAIGDYQTAQRNYNQALLSISDDKRSSYAPEYAAHMMRAELHISGFEYTKTLRSLYDIAIQADEFSQSLQNKLFYRLLADIIIFNKNGEVEKAKSSYCAAIEMLKPGYGGSLTALLRRKNYIETTGATKEAKDFLKRARQYF